MFPARQMTKGRRQALLLPLPIMSLLLAIWACSSNRIGYKPPPVTHLPAAQLRVGFQFLGQYGNTPNVTIATSIFEAASSKQVSLADSARLTCNGTDIKPSTSNAVPRACPRQPPGGAYHITYSDEHGVSTTVVVPVPAGSFAILSPQDGARVKIPANGALLVRYAIPMAPPNSTVAPSYIEASCKVSPDQPCPAIAASLYVDTGTPTPGRGTATATVFEDRGPPTPTPDGSEIYPTPVPRVTPTPDSTSTAVLPGATPTQRDGIGTFVLTGDFSGFQPGPGAVTVNISAQITPDRDAFTAATASFSGSASANITWTR